MIYWQIELLSNKKNNGFVDYLQADLVLESELIDICRVLSFVLNLIEYGGSYVNTLTDPFV